eukprot:366209-Chlamydomonas_euryale.AAC.25
MVMRRPMLQPLAPSLHSKSMPSVCPRDAPVRPGIKELLLKHAGVFATPHGLPPDRGIDHVIQEYPGSKPVYRPPRRVREPSNSLYGSPILFFPKKDGTLRMCIDTKAVSAQTIPQRTPIPRADMLFDCLQGAHNTLLPLIYVAVTIKSA